MTQPSFPILPPRVLPPLDPDFRPAVLANRAFDQIAAQSKGATPLAIAVEQADGSTFITRSVVLPPDHPQAAGNFFRLERLIKFLLWTQGGGRVYFQGPVSLGRELEAHFRDSPTGRFDAEVMGHRIYECPFEIALTTALPAPKTRALPLGRHLNGCRIGFDLGGSDRKVATVHDGQTLFSEEVAWEPVPQTDPQYHYDGIMDSLRRAAQHLPRVDAIGGSAAGVYVNNRVKIASLFRGVPSDLFASRVKDLFLELKAAWHNVPFEVVNDGEVTALAGSMALGQNGVLGIAMGTSMAGGYVTPDGNITTWLNELAFAPIDYRPGAPRDEWSGDLGCGAQYFSQQAVARLLPAAGIRLPAELPLPKKLEEVQNRMAANDPGARRIYETIGVYLGYALAHYADFYAFSNVLVLGRVTTGPGGDVILQNARKVFETEFPALAAQIRFHVPDEASKRHGQAVAAASLPHLD